MCGCGSCEAPWIREEVAVGYERRGVDDHLDEPFASSRREVTCGCETSVGATGRATGGVGALGRATCGVGGGAVDASDGTGYGAMWGCTTCEATWKCEGASVESEGSGVDEEGGVLFACPECGTMWGCETHEGAVWRVSSGARAIRRATSGVATVITKNERGMKYRDDGPHGKPPKIPLEDLPPCGGHHCCWGERPVRRSWKWVGDPGSGRTNDGEGM
jgi:hypothetical protein